MRPARLIWAAPVAAGAVVAAVLLLRGSPDEAVGERFFGVVPNQQPSTPELRKMASGEVGHVRFLLYWPSVQDSPDAELNWIGTDAWIRGLAQNGIEPVPFVFGTPGFAAEDPLSPPVHSPEAERSYGAFLRAAVERYGPGGEFWRENPSLPSEPVRIWQIWNEQNSLKFFQPRPSPREYARLLEISHAAIESVDADAEILLGGMFGTPSSSESMTSWAFLERLYRVDGIEERFDAIGINPYSPSLGGIEAQLDRILARASEAGDQDVRLWVSEIGWASEGSGSQLIKGRRGQARMLEKAFELFVERHEEWNLDGVTWYTWRDTSSGDCVWCPHAGLLDGDGRAKPAWREFQSFTR